MTAAGGDAPGGADAVDGLLGALLDDDAQTLWERAPCGYLSSTPDGTIVRANTTFLDLTGYPRDALVGRKRFVDLLTGGGRIYHETHYAPLLRVQGSAREIALDLVRADDRRIPVLVTSVLERDAAGAPVVIRTAVFDASHRRRYEQELLREKERATALARTLQQTLIPPSLPAVPGLELGAEYRPAGDGSEVGGDFYDVFRAGDGDWVVVIGDVCGKGAEAAVVTALARYTLRAAAVEHPSPARALAVLNDALLRADVDRFATVAVLRLRRADRGWQVTSCSAGHPLPLHVDARGGVTALGEAGSLLGVLAEVDLVEATAPLAPGEALVVHTDGVTEARAADGLFFGEDGLLRSLAAATGTAGDRARALLADVLRHQRHVARDDIAVVVLRVPPD